MSVNVRGFVKYTNKINQINLIGIKLEETDRTNVTNLNSASVSTQFKPLPSEDDDYRFGELPIH